MPIPMRAVGCSLLPATSVEAVTQEADATAPYAELSGAAVTVLRFIDALNDRDLSTMVSLLADDCHHEDLSHETEARSKEEVARFYADVVASMPERLRVVVDDITSGDPLRAGLVWHMEVDGTEVPCSRGLSFYRVLPVHAPAPASASTAAPPAAAAAGPALAWRIAYVRQSPEHFLKLAHLALTATATATPLIDSLGPLALPSFWGNLARGASHMLAAAPPVEQVLQSLAAAGAVAAGPSGAAAGSSFAASPSSSAPRSGFPLYSMVPQQPAPPAHQAAGASPARAAAAAAAAAHASLAPGPSPWPQHPQPHPRGSPVARAAAVAAAPAPTRSAHATPAPHTTSAPAPPSAAVPPAAARLGAAAPTYSAGSLQSADLAAAAEVGAAAEAAADAMSADQAAAAVAALSGVWEKDLERSDVAGYEAALELWGISGMQKATARLIEGLQLEWREAGRGAGPGAQGGAPLPGGTFAVHFLTVIPYFKVTEPYPLDGGAARMRRRDQRGGDARGTAAVVPRGVVCRATWGEPYRGEFEESYVTPPGQPDVLHVTSTIRVGAREATTLQVYKRRAGASARDIISESERRNGKAADILRRMGVAAP